jgi:hypothetical protein
MNKADATDYVPLSTVLPATLEVLSLRYSKFFSDWDPQLQFIYENDIGDVGGAQWNVDTWATRENWAWYETYFGHLSDFLLQKVAKFPELKQIAIHIDNGRPKPRKEIMNLANDTGVVVSVEDLKEEAPAIF